MSDGRSDTKRWRAARREAIRRSRGLCGLCGGGLDTKTPRAVHVDHIRPLASGGDPFEQSNLRAVHAACHIKHTGRQQSAAWAGAKLPGPVAGVALGCPFHGTSCRGMHSRDW